MPYCWLGFPLSNNRPDRAIQTNVRPEIHRSLSEVERDWCKFEQEADATAFQSFAWLATWQSHVGSAQGVLPVIIIGRDERHNI
jgi:CelD/BcsL family acetyltransferase involved in cellulose biosynthesis